ncbi:NAD(P)/FAD-dependent oxidoreductase [Kushneria indalinina]|uniref:Assimilatory nitrate reductase (NADH) beta subunit n=1 Tax=Kushneria indalinina DSM 14324 TaxID=1122140 RepID=A0A3D9DYA6_9GAMM|nr:FAD-dependent oxidoreductase [Kushneria indalinina]REC95770.1 assimilatory nitrate reductase (NADH) beta subunit [Kushneria indalinina DSM 14324]
MTTVRDPQPDVTPQRVLIIGNGMATQRLLEALVTRPERPPEIHVFGDEGTPAYNRILLSPLLAGEVDEAAIGLRNRDWFEAHNITLHCGRRITAIDRTARQIIDDRDERHGYDHLIIATGSRARLFDLPGAELQSIHGFRTTGDVASLMAAGEHTRRAVVIGGGLLGLEAAEGLRKRGLEVTVVHRGAHLMNRQLDDRAAELLADELQGRGLTLRLERHPVAYESVNGTHVAGVRLDDGEHLEAGLVVVAAGIVPNAEPGFEAGLAGDRAIRVDDTLTTSDASVMALGECCEFERTTFGLVDPIWAQVEVMADRLCGGDRRYALTPSATRLKVSGVELYTFGLLAPEPGDEVLRYLDADHGDYRRLILRNNRLVGAVLYGDTRDGPWYFRQSVDQNDLSPCRDTLLFGATDAIQQLEEAA